MAELKLWQEPGLSIDRRADAAYDGMQYGGNRLLIIQETIESAVADASPRWVPVGEALPECDEELGDEAYFSNQSPIVLALLATGFPITARFCDSCVWQRIDEDGDHAIDFYVCREVTHWIPLPAPPKEEDAK